MSVMGSLASPALAANAILKGNLPEPVTLSQAEIAPGLVSQNDASLTHWQPVALDHPWRRMGWCQSPLSTYRLTFMWEGTGPAPDLGLQIHRAGNRVGVWLQGVHVAQFGAFHNPNADYANMPLLVRLPGHVVRPGMNVLLVQVAGDCRRQSGLSTIELGAYAQVARDHAVATDLRMYPLIAVITLCALLTLASLFYAWSTPGATTARRFAWVNAIWLASSLLWLMREPPVPHGLWMFAIDATYAMWVYLITRLCMTLTGTFRPWIGRLQNVVLTQYLVIDALATAGIHDALKVPSMHLALVVYFGLTVRQAWHTWRQPDETRLVISCAIFPIFSLGALDNWNIWMSPDPQGYQSYYYSPAVAMVLLLALGLLMIRQFQQAMRNDRQYQATLEQEVAHQRQALATHYQHEKEHARQLAVQAERQRIVRDMHDGLGSQLVGMLAAVKMAPVDPEHLEDDLTLAMEQLRATMDSLGNASQDLSTMLAQFRFHQQPRLKRAGIELSWQVQPLPDTPWPPAAMWHMQQMLREVLANIQKHAQAGRITVSAGCEDGVCHIRVSDDGRGFDLDAKGRGRGLSHLHDRARQIGVTLALRSQPGAGTTVSWTWPQGHLPHGPGEAGAG